MLADLKRDPITEARFVEEIRRDVEQLEKEDRETAHLLRSPANAKRLLSALARALKGGRRRLVRKQLRREGAPEE